MPAWIGAAYFFTASTSFANPAVTIGRAFTDSFSGSPQSVALFIAAQFVRAAIGAALTEFFYPRPGSSGPLDLPDPSTESPMTDKPSVLFVCVHNAGRSQMAAAYLAHLRQGRIEVRSAGSAPADNVNPSAVAAMAEEGIDMSAGPRRF